MQESFPTLPGAESWSSAGKGDRARIGVAMVHGFTGNPVSVTQVGQDLAERGFTVDVPRLPGHGTHWKDMARTTYADWRGEVDRTLDRLSARCDAVVLAGLSMGGTLVLDVGTQRQAESSAVVAINPALIPVAGVRAVLSKVLSKVLTAVPSAAAGLAKNDIAKGGDEKAYPIVPLRAAQSLMGALPGIAARLPELRIPVVIASSRHDHSVPSENAEKAFSLVGSDDKRLLVLERSYHVATMDCDAGVLVDEIAALAERVARP